MVLPITPPSTPCASQRTHSGPSKSAGIESARVPAKITIAGTSKDLARNTAKPASPERSQQSTARPSTNTDNTMVVPVSTQPASRTRPAVDPGRVASAWAYYTPYPRPTEAEEACACGSCSDGAVVAIIVLLTGTVGLALLCLVWAWKNDGKDHPQ
jgi:hypothetical protein